MPTKTVSQFSPVCQQPARPFQKWEGLGNDFVIIDSFDGSTEQLAALSQAMCDRHRGIGADGLIVAVSGSCFTHDSSAQLSMEIINADGSTAAMCGNGIRCLAAYALRQKLIQGESFVIDTRSGLRSLTVSSQGNAVKVNMGRPRFASEASYGIPPRPLFEVSMGNPHRVIIYRTDDPEPEVAKLGPQVEWLNGQSANVEFIRLIAPDRIKMRVWERGAGETMACGTGACAAFAAAYRQGLCSSQAEVLLPGGTLQMQLDDEGSVLMTGAVREVFSGIWNPDPIADNN